MHRLPTLLSIPGLVSRASRALVMQDESLRPIMKSDGHTKAKQVVPQYVQVGLLDLYSQSPLLVSCLVLVLQGLTSGKGPSSH